MTHSARSPIAASVISEREPRTQPMTPDPVWPSRLRDPEDFFLHFRHPLESALDGQVPSGDHDASASPPHAFPENPGEIFESLTRLDL